MSNPVFEFDLRLTARDPSGYYYPRWDLAEKITVRAATKQEAVNKAAKALGKASRGWPWTAVCDNIREVAPEGGEGR